MSSGTSLSPEMALVRERKPWGRHAGASARGGIGARAEGGDARRRMPPVAANRDSAAAVHARRGGGRATDAATQRAHRCPSLLPLQHFTAPEAVLWTALALGVGIAVARQWHVSQGRAGGGERTKKKKEKTLTSTLLFR
jgi:hypothetical protein